MIETTVPRQYYTGNGSTQIFAVPFEFFLASDLRVYLTDPASPETDVLKTLDSDYLVTGGAGVGGTQAATGSISFITAPSSGFTLTIVLATDRTQTLDMVDNDPFPAASVEAALDRCVLIMQQVADASGRGLQQLESDTATIGRLPAKATRASMFLAFDSDGNPIASSGGISPSIPVSSFMETLLDDTDATAARATLLIPSATETLSNKSFPDTLTSFIGSSDVTKKFRLLLSSITTSMTRIWTVPDFSDTFVGVASAQTLLLKTLTSPSIGGTVTGGATYTAPILTTPLLNGHRQGLAAKTATYIALVTDNLITMDVSGGGFTTTLPTAPAAGQILIFKKIDSSFNICTISRGGSSDTIGTAATTTTAMHTQGEVLTLMYDGTSNWIVLSRHIPSSAIAYVPTVAGLGTVASVDIWYKRMGDSVYLFGRLTAGTVSGTTFSLTLPSGTAKGPTGIYTVGSWWRNNSGGTAVKRGPLILAGGDSTIKMGSDDFTTSGVSPLVAIAGNTFFGNAQDLAFNCIVPITGWNG